jgi:predicted Rossmann fold nucleotide-binding protein DprA/Smf involved in DNA uptake
MNQILSDHAKAILLLTAPLLAGRGEPSSEILKLSEYNALARNLHGKKHQPADLLGPRATSVIDECRGELEGARLERLLGRGFLLSQAIERWHARTIWVVSRADAEYPSRLRERLKEKAPPALYGCGDAAILEAGGLAVVGSRDVSDILIRYAESVGSLAAQAGFALVSGGARGIDQAAMRGALEGGGKVTGVLADSLEPAALTRDNREAFMDGRLVLVSPFDPAAGFNIGNAMQRNKLVYALADAALVVSSDLRKGGTWAGAIEQLEKYHLVPVYVRTTEPVSNGLDALRHRGALSWPNPTTPEELARAVSGKAEELAKAISAETDVEAEKPKPEQLVLPFGTAPADTQLGAPDAAVGQGTNGPAATPVARAPADRVFTKAHELLAEAKDWLKRLVANIGGRSPGDRS